MTVVLWILDYNFCSDKCSNLGRDSKLYKRCGCISLAQYSTIPSNNKFFSLILKLTL